jgi:hypothetical protein
MGKMAASQEREIVMASKITITLDEDGNAKIDTLPPGAFCSSVAMPPEVTERDVISINVGDSYTIEINAASGLSGSLSAVPPVTLESWTATQVVFSVEASQLPVLQNIGMAMCKVGPDAVAYSVSILVNPATVSLALGIDETGMWVNQSQVPVGVYCDPVEKTITTWAGGGYSFAFSLPPGDLRIDSVEFDPPAAALPYLISGDEMTAWVFNNNTAEHSGSEVHVLFIPKSVSGAPLHLPPIDPTIINNPINQGGGNVCTEVAAPQYELVGALA